MALRKVVANINFLRFTRYQLLVLICVYSSSFLLYAPNYLFSVFGGIKPQWMCPGDTLWTQNCTIYGLCQENVTHSWSYYSAVTEFDLVCDRGYIGPLIATIQMLGMVSGTILFGQISDLFGRKITIETSFFGISTCSLISTFATSWETLAAFRYATGFFIGGYIIGLYTFAMEIVEPNQRSFVRACFNMWGTSRFLYAVVAYMTGDWRSTFQVLNLLVIPVLGTGIIIAREPPRWLVQRGRLGDAKATMKYIASINGQALSDADLDHLDRLDIKERKYTYRDLFRTRILARRAVLSAFLYFACAFLNYGVEYKTGQLPGNIYVVQLLIGGSIAIGKPFIYLVDRFLPGFSRPRFHQLTVVGVLICLIAAAFMDNLSFQGSSRVTIFVYMVASVILEWHWDAINLVVVELFPTAVRSCGFAFSAIIGRMGPVIAPQIVYLSTLWWPLMYVIFISFGLITLAISYFCLPDTKNQELPDTLALKAVDLKQKPTDLPEGTGKAA